jgi:nicotinamidase/pyrazinamidase
MVIFWDIDTQFDFMNPQGKLYVPGADGIVDNVSRARRFALENGHSIIASTDWHSLEDKEISLSPDYKVTFPAHCLAGEPGSQRVGYLGRIPVEPVTIEATDETLLRTLVDKKQFHLVIRADSVDLFSNPNTAVLLDLVQPKTSVVLGVALDVCVYHTVTGLLRWGKSRIMLLKDAVKGLGIKKDEDIYREFQANGVTVVELEDLERQL